MEPLSFCLTCPARLAEAWEIITIKKEKPSYEHPEFCYGAQSNRCGSGRDSGVSSVGNESQVMRRTLPAFAVILVIYMALTMLYTCVLFPNFGM